MKDVTNMKVERGMYLPDQPVYMGRVDLHSM